jgi:NAD(P)-dependent dehydrogenase (short-subunit alcohol dehydrogenase family)
VAVIDGKHAVVTGGGRGIGLAIARVLKERGAKVSVVSRSAADAGDGFFCVQGDVSNEESIASAFALARGRNGRISILVNNAGIAESAPLKRTGKAMWDRILGINLTGTFLCTSLVLDEMLAEKWGRIVNIASIAGLYGAPYISAYTASKHGVMGFTRAAAAELEGSGVTVNAICPGYTESDMMSQAIENIVRRTGISAPQAREQLARTNPGGRIVSAEEVAQAAIALIEGDANDREVVLPAP